VGTLPDITGHRVAVEVCLGEVGIELAKPLAAIRIASGCCTTPRPLPR